MGKKPLISKIAMKVDTHITDVAKLDMALTLITEVFNNHQLDAIGTQLASAGSCIDEATRLIGNS